jgi:hypothetical protein
MTDDRDPFAPPIPRRPERTPEEAELYRTPLTVGHEWQFKALFAYGWAVSEGWNAELKSVIEDIEQIVTNPVDRQIFSWLQVKEKFGGLRMYARVELEIDAERMTSERDAPDLLDVLRLIAGERLEIDERGVRLAIPDPVRERIFERIAEAERRCAVMCEVCGAPGELIREGWHRVRCAEHVNYRYSSTGGDS